MREAGAPGSRWANANRPTGTQELGIPDLLISLHTGWKRTGYVACVASLCAARGNIVYAVRDFRLRDTNFVVVPFGIV